MKPCCYKEGDRQKYTMRIPGYTDNIKVDGFVTAAAEHLERACKG